MFEDTKQKRAKKRQMKLRDKRSPYAKSLELKQYRHRIQETKKSDFDDWVEDALEEYYRDREAEAKTEKSKARREGSSEDIKHDGESTAPLVEGSKEGGER